MQGWNPTNQDRNNTTILYTIFTSCAILPSTHTTNSLHAHYPNASLILHTHQTCHSALLIPHPFYIQDCMSSSNKSLQHNLHPNMPYRLSTAHSFWNHSFCIQHRPYWLLCSVAMKHQHNPFSAHNNMHYSPSTTNSTAFHVQDNSLRYS